jgi:hypothetical protein
MALLTDQILASGVSSNDLVHIVITGDTSQNPAGSSFKATIQQIATAIGSPGFSGGTVPYDTYFSSNLSANTFYATTYLNLPILPYLPLSGGTVTGGTIFTSGVTANTLNISSTPTTDTNLSANYLTRDSSTGDVKIKQIPGPTVYGLFSQTGNSVTVSATTTETSVIDGGIGTLSVPANGFTIGDSFRADIGGVLNAANNETIRVRVKSGSVILLDSGPQTLPTVTNDVWTMSLNFTIRQIGVAGIASIVSLGAFHYTKLSTGNVEGFSFNTVNNTTFDTTVSNTLDITIQWGSNNVGNSIYSDIFVLNKIF